MRTRHPFDPVHPAQRPRGAWPFLAKSARPALAVPAIAHTPAPVPEPIEVPAPAPAPPPTPEPVAPEIDDPTLPENPVPVREPPGMPPPIAVRAAAAARAPLRPPAA